jgi:hypothetical protein
MKRLSRIFEAAAVDRHAIAVKADGVLGPVDLDQVAAAGGSKGGSTGSGGGWGSSSN